MKTAGFFAASFIKPGGFWRGLEGLGFPVASLILISKYLEPGGTLILEFLKPRSKRY